MKNVKVVRDSSERQGSEPAGVSFFPGVGVGLDVFHSLLDAEQSQISA